MLLAAALFREYQEDIKIDLCFQGFDEELRTLPGRYAEPRGCILLAFDGATPVGCAALRPLPPCKLEPSPSADLCEVKRMYIRPVVRGRGLGRCLADQLVSFAKAADYRAMLLDTDVNFTAAIALYRSLGFAERPRYNDDDHPDTRWFELPLRS